MIKCQNCSTDNLDGSEYCDECGSRLIIAAAGHPSDYLPPQPPPPPSFTRETVTPKPATPYTPPPPAPVVHNSRAPVQSAPAPPSQTMPSQSAPPSQGGNKTVALRAPGAEPARQNYEAVGQKVLAKLIIQRGGRVGREFMITTEEAMIGRWDADGGIFPDIDLDQDDPEAKISRRHARITVSGNQFFIEDLGSTNGTFVNRGQRLLPGNRHPLNNGDEIIVGKTFLRFVLH